MTWNLADLERQLLIGSTLVEGAPLSESEAKQVLAGKTVKGHKIEHLRELINYQNATKWLIRSFKDAPYLSKDIILNFHTRLFYGLSGEHGVWKRSPNYTYSSHGERVEYLKPNKIENAVDEWIMRFNDKITDDVLHFGAKLYYDFQMIHPFDDGNGRIGRILVAYWFYWKDRRDFHFYLKDKIDHLKALEAANKGELGPLISFFKKRTKRKK